MSRTLILMRHAKSSWSNPDLADHDRPLNTRGRKSATALGDWLRAQGHVPAAGLVSSACRTRETWDRLRLTAPVSFDDTLYHAEPWALLQALRAATTPTVLLLGHNPGIGAFAQQIVQAPPPHDRFADYPTGATLVARFPGADWTDTSWHSAETVDFVIPRTLLG